MPKADARTRQRRRRNTHLVITWVFAVQIPIAFWFYFNMPRFFDEMWKLYLIFLSLWALVASHWSAFEAAHPPIQEDDHE